MLYCARAFADDGHRVTLSGFDRLQSTGDLIVSDDYSVLMDADIIVLPVMPLTGEFLNAPFAKDPIRFSALEKLVGEKPLFCGMSGKLPENHLQVFDYSAREDFLIKNAVLTAEGALEAAITEYEGSLFGADILVCGYGRIGRALSKMLHTLHANVTVAARKERDRAWIEAAGMRAIDYSFKEKYDYDLIFNTVPSLVLDRNALRMIAKKAIIFDLASLPGGVDDDYAREEEIYVLHLLSLPGKRSPLSAGRIIKETIMKIWEET
ncbi:MAG: hypothetical protein IJJ15_03845 [Ruminococcus sp.]|nr:hypothetical protein [Ruminococcus sp.]